MPFISSTKDAEALTMTVVGEFDAGVDRLWQLWKDPRQLERWWGPPLWPATFATYDLRPGGGAHYFMTGPEGEQMHGFWRITAVEAPHSMSFDDGFANSDGSPIDPADVLASRVTIEWSGQGSRMTIFSRFRSAAQLEEMVQIGMEEGMTQAVGQIDAILAEAA